MPIQIQSIYAMSAAQPYLNGRRPAFGDSSRQADGQPSAVTSKGDVFTALLPVANPPGRSERSAQTPPPRTPLTRLLRRRRPPQPEPPVCYTEMLSGWSGLR